MKSAFYENYMKSKNWQDLKQRRIEIDGHKCCMCGRHESQCRGGLQVHHLHYRTLGHENPYTDLASMCGSCHKKLHSFYDRCREEPTNVQ